MAEVPRAIPLAALAALLLLPTGALAVTLQFGGNGDHAVDLSINGTVRSDTAVRTAGRENPFNQRGNPFNGVAVPRNSTGVDGFEDEAVRNGVPADNTLNLQLFRLDSTARLRFSDNLSFLAELRAVFDPGAYDNFDPEAVGSQAAGSINRTPNFFAYDVAGRTRPNPLEWAGHNHLVQLPTLVLDYRNGPVNIRLGNQTIAWGQALFFRVLDVPNGLDLRRHSLLDYVPEEFSDKRVPSLAARVSYQMTPNWLADAYVQKFQPTVLSNPNTPYNVIASQFSVTDSYAGVDDRVSYGLRLRGDYGAWGAQAIAVRRYNPDGTYRWTESGVDRDLGLVPGTGPAMAETAFEADTTGVWSAEEWFTFAALSKLHAVEGFDESASFPAALALGAVPTRDLGLASNDPAAVALTKQQLDLFFQLSGSGLRGHIERAYHKENLFGGGLSYVTSGRQGGWLDQLIINLEVLYAPNRTFTDRGLSPDFHVADEWMGALVLEKYQRLSTRFPATYFVLQWMHRTESDLFGRHLSGFGGSAEAPATGINQFNAVAFALQQPLPNLIWRFDLAALYDTRGGLLLQPAVRWSPNRRVTVEAFYNFVTSSLHGDSSKSTLETVDFADEITLRIGYQF